MLMWIPAFERAKKSPSRLKSGPQRRPREGGDPYKTLFLRDKWIPAFAGMTLRSLPEVCNFDFFTRSQAGIHASKKRSFCKWLPWVPACAGTTLRWIAPMAALLLAGCDLSMTQQPKYAPESPSNFWANGTSARPIPAFTVAQGDLARDTAAKKPPEVTLALLTRGQQRFDMFCSPCHGLSGYGDGMVVQRGFPHPPSFYSQRLLAADVRHFYNVQTRGFGVMYSYADRVSEEDRWAIAAYIRSLQVSQHAALAMAPEAAEKVK
jgi:mono/diheme cytochrome c family protein